MTSENTQFCDKCPNHCPITDLKCGRGRRALLGEEAGQEEGREHGRGRDREERGRHGEHGRRGGRGEHGGHPAHGAGPDKDSLAGLMCACGHTLHHNGDQMDEADMFAVLSEEEQSELKRLLQRLLDSWNR